jgi:hypothetical protein
MATTLDAGVRVDRIDVESVPENVDLAGTPSPDASRFVQSVLDRAADAHDDLAIAPLVRARDERGRSGRSPPR